VSGGVSPRQEIGPLGQHDIVQRERAGDAALAAAHGLAPAAQADDVDRVAVHAELAAAPIGPLVAVLVPVDDVAEIVAAMALRHADAEMAADAVEHRAEIALGIAVDRQAGQHREAAAVAQRAAHVREDGRERRQRKIRGAQLGERETRVLDRRERRVDLVERRGRQRMEAFALVGQIGAQPGARAARRRIVTFGHARMLGRPRPPDNAETRGRAAS